MGGPTLILDQQLRTERTEKEEEEEKEGGKEGGREGGASENVGYVEADLSCCLMVRLDKVLRLYLIALDCY